MSYVVYINNAQITIRCALQLGDSSAKRKIAAEMLIEMRIGPFVSIGHTMGNMNDGSR